MNMNHFASRDRRSVALAILTGCGCQLSYHLYMDSTFAGAADFKAWYHHNSRGHLMSFWVTLLTFFLATASYRLYSPPSSDDDTDNLHKSLAVDMLSIAVPLLALDWMFAEVFAHNPIFRSGQSGKKFYHALLSMPFVFVMTTIWMTILMTILSFMLIVFGNRYFWIAWMNEQASPAPPPLEIGFFHWPVVDGPYPLAEARTVGEVKSLLIGLAKPNVRTDIGWTPLQRQCLRSNRDMFVHEHDPVALDAARLVRDAIVSEMVAAGAQWDELSLAAIGRHRDLETMHTTMLKPLNAIIFALPIEAPPGESRHRVTLLMLAAAGGHLETVHWCVENGADVRAPGLWNGQAYFALHFALGCHFLPDSPPREPSPQRVAVFQYLIAHGADTQQRADPKKPNPWESPDFAKLLGLPSESASPTNPGGATNVGNVGGDVTQPTP